MLYSSGRFNEVKEIMNNFYKVCNERNNMSKTLLALWLIFQINVVEKNFTELFEIVSNIRKNISQYCINLRESLKKTNIDFSERCQTEFKEVLLNRCYLINWSIFLLKENNYGAERYLEILIEEENLSIIESCLPNMFKYIILFSIIVKSKKAIGILKNHFTNTDDTNDEYENLFKSLYLYSDFDSVLTSLVNVKKVFI